MLPNSLKQQMPSKDAVVKHIEETVAKVLKQAGLGSGAAAEIDYLIKEKMKNVENEIDKAKALTHAVAL